MAIRLEKLESQRGSHALTGLLPPSSGHSPPHREEESQENVPTQSLCPPKRFWYLELRNSLLKWLKVTSRMCSDPGTDPTGGQGGWWRGGCGQSLDLGTESPHMCEPPQSTERESRGGKKGCPLVLADQNLPSGAPFLPQNP